MTRARTVPPRARTPLLPALLIVAASAVGSGRPAHAADGERSVAAALLAVADADPLELGRVVERFGDARVRALLSKPADVAPCLAAVRAAPMLRRPELALEPLLRLSEGRDSLLAPAAARAALAIAAGLDADALAAREVAVSELAPTRAALLALAARATVGADIRLAAATAAEALAAAGIP
jgi:hypothetical protein